MKDLALALKLAFPEAINSQGEDYYVVDNQDGNGEVVEEWNLPGTPPNNQGDVNQILRSHESLHVEYLTQREPDFMGVMERLEALEEMIEQQTGQTPPGLAKAREIRERVRNRPDSPGGG